MTSSTSTSSKTTSGVRARGFRLGAATLGRLHGEPSMAATAGAVLPGSGCGRLWDHASQVPAVLRVHHRASDFVHRQSAGHFGRYAQCQTVQGTVPVVVQRQVPRQGTGLSLVTSVYGGFKKNFLSWASSSRSSHLEIWCIISLRPRIWQSTSCVWVLLRSAVLDSSGDASVTRAQCLVRQ